jgi:hypothetical protein
VYKRQEDAAQGRPDDLTSAGHRPTRGAMMFAQVTLQPRSEVDVARRGVGARRRSGVQGVRIVDNGMPPPQQAILFAAPCNSRPA